MAKRLFPRIRTSVPVSFEIEGAVERGRIDNASMRGMHVLSARTPPPGQIIAMEVQLPGGRTTSVEARVVSVEPSGGSDTSAFALELTRPNEEYAALLGLLVAANVRKGAFRP